MKKALIPALAVLTLLLGGCNIKWTVVQDNFPNFHLIERRCQLQDQQIGTNVQSGQLPPRIAQSLSNHVEMVRHLAWEYQNPTGGQVRDLSSAETRFLGVLLNDNQMALNDALARSEQWANCFHGAWSYNFNYKQDRLLFAAVVQDRLTTQEARVEDAGANGSLSSSQVADFRSRLQVVREAELDDFQQNGTLDLKRDQMEELSQMLEDNDRYLRFRVQNRQKQWSGDHFGSWGQYKKDLGVNSSTLPKNPTSSNRYWDGRTRTQNSVQVPPTATPVPYVAPARPTPTRVPYAAPAPPTPTPVPQAPEPTAPSSQGLDNGNQKDQGKHKGFDKKNNGDEQGLDQGNHKDQGNHEGAEKKEEGDQGVKSDKVPADKTTNPSDSKDALKTDKVSADKTTNPSDAKDSAKTEKVPALVKPDALNDRYDKVMDRMREAGLKGQARADFNRLRNEFRQTLMQALKDNAQKGLTQAQFDRSNKILNDMEALFPSEDQ